jgi:hypothetical protein
MRVCCSLSLHSPLSILSGCLTTFSIHCIYK